MVSVNDFQRPLMDILGASATLTRIQSIFCSERQLHLYFSDNFLNRFFETFRQLI